MALKIETLQRKSVCELHGWDWNGFGKVCKNCTKTKMKNQENMNL